MDISLLRSESLRLTFPLHYNKNINSKKMKKMKISENARLTLTVIALMLSLPVMTGILLMIIKY